MNRPKNSPNESLQLMSAERRNTHHRHAFILKDPILIAETEARNGLLQYDLGIRIIMDAIERRVFRLRPSTLLDLHREALQGINDSAGVFRTGIVSITGSDHIPVAPHMVPHLVEEMCDYVNEHWNDASALHLASYVMWRLNWIHPFTDGNGRTSRMISYIVLSSNIRSILPGTPQIPDQITVNRNPYFSALETADKAWVDTNKIDVSAMEILLESMLARQLLNAHEAAGKIAPT